MPARLSRRTLVAAAVALPAATAVGTTGCTLSGPSPRRPTSGSSEENPDVALLREVSACAEEVVDFYERVLQRHRDLRGDLRPLLAAHREHVAALGEAAPSGSSSAAGSSSRAGSSSASRPPSPSGPASRPPGQPGTGERRAVPRHARAAVRALTAVERQNSDDLFEAAGRAASGAFAGLLASMSASAAQHVRILDQVHPR